MQIAKRIHSLNDLFLAAVVLFSLPINFLLTAYAHGIVSGAESDISSLEEQVNNYLSVPNFVITAVVSLAIPAILVALMLARRRFYDLIQIAAACLIAFLLCYLAIQAVVALEMANLSSGYSTFRTDFLPVLPSYVAVTVAILVISGPRHREQIVRGCWFTLYACSVIIVILGLVSLMSMCLVFQVGYFAGYLARFAFGQINPRLNLRELLKGIRYCGFVAKEVKELPSDSATKRVFLAHNGAEVRTVYVLDPDKKAISILSRVVKFLKYKNISLKYTTFQTQYEHHALMNYAVNNAGLNYPKLLGSAVVNESMLFLTQSTGEMTQLAKSAAGPQIQRAFWEELGKAHCVGITYHKIDLNQLCLFNGQPAIWEAENGETASAKLFRRLDTAQMLAAFALLSSASVATAVYMSYLNSREATDKLKVRELSEVVAFLDPLVMPPLIKAELKQVSTSKSTAREFFSPLSELKNLLLEHIENDFATNLTPAAPEYKRVSLKSLVMIGLTVVAGMALLAQLDFDAVLSAFSESDHFWTVLCFGFGFFTFLGGALALKGFGHAAPVNLLEAYQVQMAAGWESVRMPAGLGPITVNIQYLNKLPSKGKNILAKNTAIGGIVQTAQAIASFAMLFVCSVLSGSQIKSSPQETEMVILVVSGVLLAALVGMLIPQTRKYIMQRVRPLVKSFADSAVETLRKPSSVVLGFCGCLVQEMGYALSLWAALEAFGQHLPFFSVFLVFLISNAAGATVPSPGGLGVIEAALTLGLTTLGIPATVALSVTLLYRVCIFWARIPLGIAIEKRLEKAGKI